MKLHEEDILEMLVVIVVIQLGSFYLSIHFPLSEMDKFVANNEKECHSST